MNLSVTIITLNEEANIANAIRSVDFAEEVIVVDSGSSDRTCEIAQSLGATVYVNTFEGYGQQKNFAASKSKCEWIFNLDADEVVDHELASSIKKAIRSDKNVLYRVNRLTYYCGKEVKHGGWYPDRVIRIYPRKLGTFTEPNVHELVVAKDPQTSLKTIDLSGHLEHYSFPTIASQVQTNIKYAKLGAQTLLSKNKNKSLLQLITRPFFKFLECYLWKRGFLDGQTGFIIAINAAHSQFMKYAMARQLTKDVEGRKR